MRGWDAGQGRGSARGGGRGAGVGGVAEEERGGVNRAVRSHSQGDSGSVHV